VPTGKHALVGKKANCCIAQDGGAKASLPTSDGQESAYAERTKKKRNLKGYAFKNPPKEEVLEECAAASSAVTQEDYCSGAGRMQAFSAALQYIVDSIISY
jgi:hypothetical protein